MTAVEKANEELRKKLNLNHLSEDECEAVLKVIQRDFDLRQHEKDRLNKIEEEVQDEESKTGILAKQKNFNDNCCMRCFSKFIFIFNTKVVCSLCHFNVCKSCSEFEKEQKEHICHVCLKQRELSKASGEWFYNNVKKKFKRFGSAKVVRSLYKRKTESEESDYAMSDSALYGRDESTGRKRQPQLTGMFEMDLDDTSTMKPLERAKRMENGSLVTAEEDIIAQKRSDKQYTTPYTCPVGTGRKTFDEACATELKNFHTQLDTIVQEINRVLDNNVPTDNNDNQASGVNAREEYEKLVDNHKLHLSSAISNLSQSLNIAIDNQDVLSSEKSPTAKHQLVKQKVVKQCEHFIGSPLDMNDEDITSEYGSESGTEGQPPKPHEDLVAQAIVKKLIGVHQKKRENDLKEEGDLLRSLKNLENKATLSSLNADLSGSETDTSFNKTREESHMSEGSDVENIIVQTRREPIGQCLIPDDKSNKLIPKSPYVPQKYISNDELDDLVRSNTLESGNRIEDDEWSRVEGIRSPVTSQNSTSLLDSDVFTRDIEKSSSKANKAKHSTPLKSQDFELNGEQGEKLSRTEIEQNMKILKQSEDLSTPVTKRYLDEEDVLATSLAENDDTLLASKSSSSSIEEDIIEPVSSFRDEKSPRDDDDNISAFSFVQNHEITLPSFEITEDSPSEVDLDDISHMSSDMDEYPMDEPVVTLDGNITFGSNWSLSTNSIKNRSFISAYDNFGNKKVGKEGGSPTIMLVPKADDELSVARIGDVNADDLSDLSENDDNSDIELDESSSEDETANSFNAFFRDDEDGYFDSEGHFVIGRNVQTVKKRRKSKTAAVRAADSGVQTEDFEHQSLSEDDRHDGSISGSDYSSQAANQDKAEQEIVIDPVAIEKKVKEKAFDIDERPPSPDIEDVDPKFVKKPEKMVSVMEGEAVKFDVQVEGTKPLDVFWYNDMADIVDLADDDRCDIQQKAQGMYTCEMFNTTKSDQGQYLCIAINELGQCSRAFKLKILDNTTDKVAPEFIKPIHDIEAVEGASVKLRCKLKGYPHPRVLWYKDGKRIRNSPQYQIEKLGNRDYVLSIDYLTLDDDAEFSVVAKNIVGEVKAVAQVIVEPKEPDEPVLADTPRKQNSSLTKSNLNHLYPDTDDLVRLAKQVQSTRTQVTGSAEDMLTSADRLSRLERVLNVMETSLDNVESDPMLQRDSNGNDPFNSSYRDTLWREHEEMRDHASNIRITTAHALEFLTSMDNDLFANRDQPPDPEEEIDVNFTYDEYEILYKERKISTDQIRKGKLKRKDLPKMHEFLRQFKDSQKPGDSTNENGKRHSIELVDGSPTTINCGLKRVDSKKYKKDYVIVRDTPKARRKKWEVRSPSMEAAEVVKSTPAGEREDPNHEIEEQVYLATSQVFQLQDQIKQYEDQVSEIDDHTSPRQMLDMEKTVAKVSAQVAQSDHEVSNIEEKLHQHEYASPRSPMSPVTKTHSYTHHESHSPRQHPHDNQKSHDTVDPEFRQIRLKRTPNKQVEQEIQEAAEQQHSLNNSVQLESPRDNLSQSEHTTQHKEQFFQFENSDLINFENNNNVNEVKETVKERPAKTATKVDNSTSFEQKQSQDIRRNSIEESPLNSSTEVDEEENMPSVKSLLTKFKHDFPPEDDETCNLRRQGGDEQPSLVTATTWDMTI